MNGFLAITRVTLQQLVGGKRFWGLLALAGLPALITVLAGRSVSEVERYRFFHEGPLNTFLILIVPIVAVVVGTAALGDERRHETLSFLVLRPIPRSVIVAAKTASAWVASFAICGLGGAAAAIVFGLIDGSWRPLPAIIVLAALNTLGYAALFVPLGYLVSRAALIGLAFIFLWDTSLTVFVTALAPYSISRIGLSAYVALVERVPIATTDVLGSVDPGTGGAVAKAAVLTALAVALTSYLMRRRDLV